MAQWVMAEQLVSHPTAVFQTEITSTIGRIAVQFLTRLFEPSPNNPNEILLSLGCTLCLVLISEGWCRGDCVKALSLLASWCSEF